MSKTVQELKEESDTEEKIRLETDFKSEHNKFCTEIESHQQHIAEAEKRLLILETLWEKGQYKGTRPRR
jgi:hypothetical protein